LIVGEGTVQWDSISAPKEQNSRSSGGLTGPGRESFTAVAEVASWEARLPLTASRPAAQPQANHAGELFLNIWHIF